MNSNVKFVGTDEDQYRRHWDIITDVNVKGTANTLRAVMPGMIATRTRADHHYQFHLWPAGQ